MRKTRLTPTEVVAGVFACLRAKGTEAIPNRREEIHSAFYHMRNQGLGILNDFRFDTRGMFPYSPTLQQATSNLATSLLLERRNPKLEVYGITEDLGRYYDQTVMPRTTRRERQQLEKTAAHLLDELTARN